MSDQSNGPDGWDALGAEWRRDEPSSSFADVDPAVIRARAESFARSIRWRNAREVAAGVAVALGGVGIAARASSSFGWFGGVAMAVGALVVSATVALRGRNASPPPPDAPTRDVIAFERAELGRQARLLERVWLWYLAPFVPSIVAIYAGSLRAAFAKPDRTGGIVLSVLLFGVTVAFFVLVGWWNARAARELRRRMKALEEGSS